MLSVSLIKCKKEASKKSTSKASLSALRKKNRQVTGFTILICPIDRCVRINCNLTVYLMVIFSYVYLIVNASVAKLLYSWILIDTPEHHYTTQISKFKNFVQSSIHNVI